MKKYKKGEPIKSLEELMEQEFIIHKIGATEKTLHSSWFQNWQLRWANQYINKKVLYKAIKNGKGEQK